MEKKYKQRITYILAYTACLICPPLLLSGIFHQEVRLWTDWVVYLPLFIAGVAGMFCNKKIQNLIFLLQIPTAFQMFFSTCYNELLHTNYTYYVVITTIIICAFYILWHAHFQTIVNTWQILCSIYLGFLYIYIVLIILSKGTHEILMDLWVNPHTAAHITYTIGLLITAIFCQFKSEVWKWGTTFCVLCPYIFISGFYIAPAIYHKLQYGTFTGEIRTKASLVLKSTDGNKTEETFQGYQVCLITKASNLWSLKKFEGLAAKYRGKPVHFLTLAIYKLPERKKVITQRYKILHLQTPLYFIAQNVLKSSPLRIKTSTITEDYICIFKDSMLIYKGTAGPTFQADRFLSQKLQP